jgi:tetratricopeptide (TPR) repeat protein
MTCDEVSGNEIVERYVLGQLTGDERDAFEQHYFECARCFDLLRTYKDLQTELARTRDAITAASSRSLLRQWAWLPAAAVLLLSVSVVVWQRSTPGPAPSSSTAEPPANPSTAPGSTGSPATSPQRRSLDDLARFDPPRYQQGRLRGAADAATAKFQTGMDQYQRNDFASARASLSDASKLDPEAAHIAFFLGITKLLTGQPNEAADDLRRTIALGDSPYREEAHFYLAKAHLKLGRVDDALAELERVVQLRGSLETQARALRNQLETFQSPSR